MAQDEQIKKDDSPYALVADLIGIAQGGPANLARNHKQAFRDMLANWPTAAGDNA